MSDGRTARFGVLFSGSFPLREALDGCVLADRLGYNSAWFGEDYFYLGGIATAPSVMSKMKSNPGKSPGTGRVLSKL